MSDPSSTKPPLKTVFIVGAGASKEVQLPIGYELKKSIAAALDIRVEQGWHLISGNDQICEALRIVATKNPKDENRLRMLQHAGWHIRDAMPQSMSIDQFMDANSGNEDIKLCGKLAIVSTILEAEESSLLYFDNRQGGSQIDFDRLETTWFQKFIHLLTASCTSADLATRLSSIAFIVFNYDRCIEHFLYYAIQNFYRMSAQDAAKLLQNLEIYHPYGSVGSLPWLSSDNAIEFGASTNGARLLQLASEIKTFTEGTDEASSDVNAIRHIMKTSQKLVFLGFAFHDSNVALLLPDDVNGRNKERHIFATAHDISDSNTKEISADLKARCGIYADNIQVRNTLKCNQLFTEYSRSMALNGNAFKRVLE